MDDWTKDFFQMLDDVAIVVDEFFVEVAGVVEEFVEEMQNSMSTDIDEFLHELFEPLVEVYSELEDVANEPDQYFGYTYWEQPTQQRNPACVGCHHYHGQVYGGNLFVCGMHPYGWEDENCPDWQSEI